MVTTKGYIYAFEWFVRNPIAEWQARGFAVADVQRVFDTAIKLIAEDKCYYPDRSLAIFEENLIRYTAAAKGYTDRLGTGSGHYNLYISYTRWNSLDEVFTQYLTEKHGELKVYTFKELLKAERSGDTYVFKGDAVKRWVDYFDIPRADFEMLNEKIRTRCREAYGEDSFEYWNSVFIEKDIDDIYNLSLQDFNRRYANPCTYLRDKMLISVEWILKKTAKELWQYGLFKGPDLLALAADFAESYPEEKEDVQRLEALAEEFFEKYRK